MVGAAAAALTCGAAMTAVVNRMAKLASVAVRLDAISADLVKSRHCDAPANQRCSAEHHDRDERQQNRLGNLRNNWRWSLGKVFTHCRIATAARVIELRHSPRVFDRPHEAVVVLGDGRGETEPGQW